MIVVKRVMPRQNEEVNEIWLCDKGRFAYHYTEGKKTTHQADGPQGEKLGALRGMQRTKLLPRISANKKDFVVLASGRLSNEDLFNLKSLADHAGGKPFCTPIWAAVS
jgi:NADH-quinone oxidoreductase subunit G